MSNKNKKINSYFTSDLSTEHLSKNEKKELENLIKQITDEAKLVVEDYIKNPSELSGSSIQIHSDSPLLKEKN